MKMTLREAIKRWRALPPEEKARRRWSMIPMKVAMSMAFEGEPVDLNWLEAAHAKRALDLVAPHGQKGGSADSTVAARLRHNLG